MKHITTFLLFATFAAFGALAPSTTLNEISGTNTIADIVSAGGGGGGGGGTDGQAVTNIVKGLTDAPLASKRGIYDLNIYSQNKAEFWGIQYWDVDIVFAAGVSIRGRSGAGSIEGNNVYWDGTGDESFSIFSSDGHVINVAGFYPFTTTMDSLTGSNDFATWTLVPHYAQLATTATVAPLIPPIVTNVVEAVFDERISPTDAVFSNAVLSVAVDVDSEDVSAMSEFFADVTPIEGATTLGGLLAAIVAAIAALQSGKADNGAKWYDLHLLSSENVYDRAISSITMSDALTLAFPTAVTGKARDFVLFLTVADDVTTPTISLPEGISVCGDDLIVEAGKQYLIAFTEIAENVFKISVQEITVTAVESVAETTEEA